jgi:hypothetical protein
MADEKNLWTKAFEYEATNPELSGKEKTEKIKEIYRQKKAMSGDQPRTNDINEYNPKRRAMITKARNLGLTSPADMEKAAEDKKAARRAAYAESKSSGARGERSSNPDIIELNIMDLEKKAKGGLVGRGQGKAIKIKTTKFY